MAAASTALRAWPRSPGRWPLVGPAVGAQREPDEQRHGEHRAHRHQQLESDAALVQRLAEQPLAGEQNGGAGDEQHAETLALLILIHGRMIPDAAPLRHVFNTVECRAS